MLYTSIVLDMCLLLGLIWSFHLQYQQPRSFYLKSPTLLYVFIFIALRALRFEARYVVAAGLVAAAGWTGLASYAIYTTGTEMVTRDYVYYMTNNAVLVGAEFDKIISILLVTAIIAVAINRAWNLLNRSVTEGQAAQDLSRFFSPEIADQITASEEAVSAGSGQTREAAILFCDIRGFTSFSNTHQPNEVIAMLADYQHQIVPILQKHGGTIDKFMGDGIMVTFGAALPTETFAADALRAVDELMLGADLWNAGRVAAGEPELRVGAAVASGRLIFGAVGDASRLEYTVIGDAVNLAAKLEKATKDQKVRAHTTRETYETALAPGYAPPDTKDQRAACAVDGVEAPRAAPVLAVDDRHDRRRPPALRVRDQVVAAGRVAVVEMERQLFQLRAGDLREEHLHGDLRGRGGALLALGHRGLLGRGGALLALGHRELLDDAVDGSGARRAAPRRCGGR